MIQDLLSEDNVSFHYPAETWEDVIRHGGQLMVDAGFTDPSYTEAMVVSSSRNGPIYRIGSRSCYATCSPRTWCKACRNGFGDIGKTIEFCSPDNDPVSVALFLCAPNKDEHIQLLTDIATLFEAEEFLDAAVDFEVSMMFKHSWQSI